MDTIHSLVAQKYDLMNVDGKYPVNINGEKWMGWNVKPYAQLVANHNYDSRSWGFRCGKQTNGKQVLSLDFDICGPINKSSGKRVPCEFSREKYEEFASLSDDWYNGGTEGNFNALIEYSQSSLLMDALNKLNNQHMATHDGKQLQKITIHNLEIIIRGNQLIPPSQSTCKLTHELGRPRQFNAQPICIVEESSAIEDFILRLLEKEVKVKVEHKEHKEQLVKKEDKWLDLLFNVIQPSTRLSYSEWFKLRTSLKRNGYEKQIFLDFCEHHDTKQNESSNLWDQTCTDNISLQYLQKLAKQYNPTNYQTWLSKHDIYFIKYDDLLDTYETARILKPTLFETVRFCEEEWYMLTKDNLWKCQKEVLYYVITELRTFLDETVAKLSYKITKMEEGEKKEEMRELREKYTAMYRGINSQGYSNSLIKYLKTELRDDDFAKLIDNNPGKLAFQNGIMDLETRQFTDGIRPDDYISRTIPFNYEKTYDQTKYTYFKSKLQEIMNNDPEHVEYFSSLIGYCFLGKSNLEKSMYFCIDKTDTEKGNNGKSITFELLTELMPCYCYKSKKTLLESSNVKVHKQLAMMKRCRMVWLDEFSKNKVNDELLRELAVGKQVENEVMFGTSENIDVQFKVWVLTNSIPKLTEEASYNRFKQLSFTSHFDLTGERKEANPAKKEYIADKFLQETLVRDYRNEIFEWVIHYANSYGKNKIPKIPSQFLSDAMDTKYQNDGFASWFNEHLERHDGSKTALKHIVWESGLSEKEVKEGMKRLGFKYDSTLRGCGEYDKDGVKTYHKGGYVGCRDKPEEVDLI